MDAIVLYVTGKIVDGWRDVTGGSIFVTLFERVISKHENDFGGRPLL
jgi:hypothetical protein